eukprot:jgi/Psemu1/54710/gm1.54710_g
MKRNDKTEQSNRTEQNSETTVTRILSAINPVGTNFKQRKETELIREILAVTDEAFALMIIDNELGNWEKQKKRKLDATGTTPTNGRFIGYWLSKLLTIQSAPPSYTLVSKRMISRINHGDGISHGDNDHANKLTIQPAMVFSKVQILQALQAKIENQQIAPTNPVNPNPSVPPSATSSSQQEDDGIDLDLFYDSDLDSNSDPNYKNTPEY